VDSVLHKLGVCLAFGIDVMFRNYTPDWVWVARGGFLPDGTCGMSLFCVHALHAPWSRPSRGCLRCADPVYREIYVHVHL
jgi:hypothetical protein